MFRDIILPAQGETRYIFFSGKGGVGKTTTSASTAVWLAKQGFKTLIVSTDLQRSLNDVFGQDIKSEPTPITGVPNLKAVTIDTAESIERNRKQVIGTLQIIDPDSLLLQQINDDKMGDCGCAQAAVFEFSYYLSKEREYDAIVFDTAPLGSTLEKIGTQTKYVLNTLNNRDIQKKLIAEIGLKVLNTQIQALEDLKQKDEIAFNNLRSEKTSFIMVMIPEGMPLAELERSIPTLEDEYHIPVRGIIINHVIPEHERDTTDFWRKKWAMQYKYINLTEDKFKQKGIAQVALLESDVLGVTKLKIIGEQIYKEEIAH